MPELPEVETVARDLKSLGLCQQAIQKVSVSWPKTIASDSDFFGSEVQHNPIQDIFRRGKYVVFALQTGFLIVHLRMTGKLLWKTFEEQRSAHEHVVFFFPSGTLRFHDTRKFGRIWYADNLESFFEHLGVDALDEGFDKADLWKKLRGKNRQIKSLLLDQHFIAGLGNIYVDESLWMAEIHPQRKSSSLSKQESSRLHEAIQTVLTRAIANKGTSLGKGKGNFYSRDRGDNFATLQVFQRQKQPCPRCKTPICKMQIAQRGTHFCPSCQSLL